MRVLWRKNLPTNGDSDTSQHNPRQINVKPYYRFHPLYKAQRFLTEVVVSQEQNLAPDEIYKVIRTQRIKIIDWRKVAFWLVLGVFYYAYRQG